MKDLIQLSPEWHEARKDRLTASNFSAAIGLNPYTSRQKLYRQIIGEEPPFEGNEATEYGNEHEPDALFAYETATGSLVTPTGFWVHPEYDWLGCSPDSLVGDTGLVEAKCKFSGELWQEVPDLYMPQIQAQLVISNRLYCDFISWAPDGLSVFRVPLSGEYWNTMFPLLETFWQSVINLEPPKRAKKPVMPQVKVERIV